MDPSATLEKIREIIKDDEPEDFDELVDLVQALDDWITKGGHLPSYWVGV